MIDDDDVIKFRWDGKGRFMDLPKLASTLEEAHAAEESMSGYRERYHTIQYYTIQYNAMQYNII